MMNIPEYTGIWVYAEIASNQISLATLELLAQSIELKKKLGGTEKISAIILGKKVEQYVDTLYSCGAEQVVCVEDEALEEYSPCAYKDALVQLVNEHKPAIFLFPESPLGRDLGPQVMRRLGTGLAENVIDLNVD